MEYSGDNSKTIIIDPIVQRERYGYRLIKRLFDVCASFTALVLLSPMFLVVAIAIKAEDSQGKVFYSQIRVGKGGKRFKMVDCKINPNAVRTKKISFL
ncbi:sugar transferase [Lactiplantibacillus plantarum]|uniref:sugar transferase n=1 Tax=Lactiplantibacillus plantarum TaxID=1590 RepID=UPI0009B51792|nr:sugar transferase [Lactiplantibacillus plantarum]